MAAVAGVSPSASLPFPYQLSRGQRGQGQRPSQATRFTSLSNLGDRRLPSGKSLPWSKRTPSGSPHPCSLPPTTPCFCPQHHSLLPPPLPGTSPTPWPQPAPWANLQPWPPSRDLYSPSLSPANHSYLPLPQCPLTPHTRLRSRCPPRWHLLRSPLHGAFQLPVLPRLRPPGSPA